MDDTRASHFSNGDNINGENGHREDPSTLKEKIESNNEETDDVKFINFAKRHLGLLTTLFSIPILSSVLEILQPPKMGSEKLKLEIISSFLCLIIFGGVFSFRGVLGKWALDGDVKKRCIPFFITFSLVLIDIILISAYNYFEWDIAKISIYLAIYCFLTLSLGVMLVTSFAQLDGQTIKTLVESRLTGDQPKEVFKLVENYANFLDLSKQNEYLGFIGKEILSNLGYQLHYLSKGEIQVHGNDAPIFQDLLLSHFKKRFDAVSDRDLEFWTRERFPYIAEVYIGSNKRAIIDHQTKVTRIFIFTVSDIRDHVAKIIKVLTEQYEMGIDWAIVVYEDLLKSPRILQDPMDFAIFDANQGVSFFRDFRAENRLFRAILRTDRNKPEIEKQLRQYDRIVSHCWLATQGFKNSCIRLNGDNVSGRLKRQNRNASPGNTAEGLTFLFELEKKEEIETKVRELRDFVNKRYPYAEHINAASPP